VEFIIIYLSLYVYVAVLGQLAKAGVFVVGQADGECAHGSVLRNWRGVWIFNAGNAAPLAANP
jgi:hypothetical protein